jgi:hypothetical protein
MHRPVPSHHNTFARSRSRLTNRYGSPLVAWRPRCSTTSADKLSKLCAGLLARRGRTHDHGATPRSWRAVEDRDQLALGESFHANARQHHQHRPVRCHSALDHHRLMQRRSNVALQPTRQRPPLLRAAGRRGVGAAAVQAARRTSMRSVTARLQIRTCCF